ncbi:MAG: hypothetical protein JO037_26295 [Actinobacteria bacterium]|nr:hypothetical protein [Actinomycetota bacterium]
MKPHRPIPLARHGPPGSGEAGKARKAIVILGCAMGILRGALAVLWWLLAPKLLKKTRRRTRKAAHRAQAKTSKQVSKTRRAARRSIRPNRTRRWLVSR